MYRIFVLSIICSQILLAQNILNFALPENMSEQKLTFDEVLQKALSANEQFLQAKEDINAQKGLAKQSLAKVLPTLTGTGTLNDQINLSGALNTTVPLVNISGILNSIGAFKQIDATKMSVERRRETLILAVSNTYWNVWLEQNLLEIAQKQHAISESQLATAKRKAKLQEISRLALKRAELLVAKTQIKIVSSEANLKAAQGSLAFLLGENSLIAVKNPPHVLALEKNKDQSFKRSDLDAQKISVQAAWASKQSANWSFIPTVDAGLGLNLPWKGREQFQATLNLTIPFYDGHFRFGMLQSADAKWRQEKYKKHLLEREIQLEIQGSLTTIKRNQELLEISNNLVEIGNISVKSAENRRAAGHATSLDVLDEQTRLFDAQSDNERAKVDLALARIRLAYTKGDPIKAWKPNG